MMIDLTHLSVREIQERFVHSAQLPSAMILARMQRDPRAAVRRLCHILKKKREREKKERLRISALLNFERVLWESGAQHVAGVDEVGVGPLAGPVVAAAVIFPPGVEILGIDDSKRLAAQTREQLAVKIRQQAVGIGIGIAEVEEIDRLNVYQAGILAMRRALETLPVRPDHVLTDARTIPGITVPQNPFHRGDGINFSIAAASILAKTYRDHHMEDLDQRYPQYGFARHKGYGTPQHLRAIRKYGPSPVHRRSYHFIEELCGGCSPAFYALKGRLQQVASLEALGELEEDFQETCSRLTRPEQKRLRLVRSRRWKTLARRSPK